MERGRGGPVKISSGGEPSAGCIRMPAPEAQAWFEFLQIGDQVQVVKASEVHAARQGR